jgi:hypothetical protein
MANPADILGAPPPGRDIYCNRTLNLRAIRAIGYDMDYTLVHYNAEAWERLAFEYLRRKLAAMGFPVKDIDTVERQRHRGQVRFELIVSHSAASIARRWYSP